MVDPQFRPIHKVLVAIEDGHTTFRLDTCYAELGYAALVDAGRENLVMPPCLDSEAQCRWRDWLSNCDASDLHHGSFEFLASAIITDAGDGPAVNLGWIERL